MFGASLFGTPATTQPQTPFGGFGFQLNPTPPAPTPTPFGAPASSTLNIDTTEEVDVDRLKLIPLFFASVENPK